MKRKFPVIFSALGILGVSSLCSCSQDDMPISAENGSMLVKAPKVIAYSGDTYFGTGNPGTRSVDVDVTPGYISYGSAEQKAVAEFFTNNDKLRKEGKAPEGGEFLTLDAFDGWTDYWVQTVDYVNTNDSYHAIKNIGIWNEFDDSWDVRNWKETDNYYFAGGEPDNDGHNKLFVGKDGVSRFDRVKYENWPITDFSYTTYLSHKMGIQERGQYSYIFGEKPGVLRDTEGTPAYRIARIDGYDEIYVAFYSQILDYYNIMAGGGAGSSGGVGVGSDIKDFGDDQWDVIIKLTRVQELCHAEGCGHPVHELGYCPICVSLGKENTDCTVNAPVEDEDNGGNTEIPEVAENGDNHNNEVEVNLHGVEKNGQYLESHLSLHIRHAGDVEVFIPVPMVYTCEADDMDIVMKHEINHMVHSSTWTLKDSDNSKYGPITVSVTVTYEEDGIRIRTSGVTEEAIAWCMEKCGDGITFEIWNYYNDPEKVSGLPNGGISLEELQYLLSRSTIEFLGESLPDYYINAFKDMDYDCTVTIVDGQAGNYNSPREGEHLNGSDKNQIFENKNIPQREE